ncbi:MAG TPA: hypothetical protein VFV34_12325 [Blastocatellia bacterium]|nr:hypothetical protein [Blastocatellia bacterium]
MRLKITRSVLVGFLLVLFCQLRPASGAEPYKVIVNTSNPVSSISKDQVSKFFLKKVTKWDNGQTVLPVELPKTSPARQAFSLQIHGKPVKAIESYWQQKIFSGRDVPPVEKPSDAQVVGYVKANAGAIGYVSGDTPAGGVKVVDVE